MRKICLIGGSGRSGTTILSKIFSNHPNLSNVPEWRFLTDPDGIIDFYSSLEHWSPYHFDIRVKRLKRILSSVQKEHPFLRILRVLDRFGLHNISPFNYWPKYAEIGTITYSPNFSAITDEFLQGLCPISYKGRWAGMNGFSKDLIYYNQAEVKGKVKNYLHAIFEDVLQDQKVDHYLEKSTWNILWFDKIKELFPEAKMVHIYRDPRDVVSSYVKQKWMPDSAVESAIIYNDLMNRWKVIKNTLPKDSFIELSLESLVEQPKQVIQEICEFWEIEWSEELLNIDLSRSNSGRWRKELSIDDQNIIESILSDQLEEYNYV